MILCGAYASQTDISDWDGSVLSLYASNDLISTVEEIEEFAMNLPAGEVLSSISELDNAEGTVYFNIEGGNHAQFGNYGNQSGDGEATIDADAQQSIMVDWIAAFFEAKGW